MINLYLLVLGGMGKWLRYSVTLRLLAAAAVSVRSAQCRAVDPTSLRSPKVDKQFDGYDGRSVRVNNKVPST